MELGLIQWVAGTRCVCKCEGERAVRGVVSSRAYQGPHEAMSTAGGGLTLDRPL